MKKIIIHHVTKKPISVLKRLRFLCWRNLCNCWRVTLANSFLLNKCWGHSWHSSREVPGQALAAVSIPVLCWVLSCTHTEAGSCQHTPEFPDIYGQHSYVNRVFLAPTHKPGLGRAEVSCHRFPVRQSHEFSALILYLHHQGRVDAFFLCLFLCLFCLDSVFF